MAPDKATLSLPSHRPRIPRLSYRNSTAVDPSRRDSFSTVSTAHTHITVSTTPTSPGWSICASPGLPSDALSPARETFPTGPLAASFATKDSSTASFTSPKASAIEAKKKGSTFFDFFSVKEPSTRAFEEYQKQMRKKAQTSSRRAFVAGLPSVSSAKLPPTVPKVNSKWDGIPEAQRGRVKKDNSLRQSFYGYKRHPVNSGSQDSHACVSTASSMDSRSRPGDRASRTSSSNKLSELYGWESASSTNNDGNSGLDVRTDSKSTHAMGNSQTHSSSNPDVRLREFLVKPSTPTSRGGISRSLSSDRISLSSSNEEHSLVESHASDHGVVSVTRASPIAPVRIALTSPSRNRFDHRRSHDAELISLDNGDLSRLSSCNDPRWLPKSDPVTSQSHSSIASPSRSSNEYSTGEKASDNLHDVVIRSTGEDILSPPTLVKRKPNVCVLSADEDPEKKKPHDTHIPHPILKKSSASHRSYCPHRPKMFSYFPAAEHEDSDVAASDIQDHVGFPSNPKGGALLSMPQIQKDAPGREACEGPLDDDIAPVSNRKSGFRNAFKRRSKMPLFGTYNDRP